MTPILGLAGLAAAVLLIDRLLLWMEWRGWIDYRRTYPGRMNACQVGPAFLSVQGLLQPEAKHAVQEQTRLRTEREGRGDGGGPIASGARQESTDRMSTLDVTKKASNGAARERGRGCARSTRTSHETPRAAAPRWQSHRRDCKRSGD